MATLDRFRLDGKVALVTGGTRGIGRAIADAFAHAGAQVVVSSRKPEAVDATVTEITAAGGRATGLPANMGRLDEVRALVDDTVARHGGIDVVVNNAAVNPVFGPVEATDEGAFLKIMMVNVQGPFELAKRVLPSMRARGGGSVINVSSIGGISPEPGLGIYSMSKAALISLTKVFAHEWGKYGIRANVICPGLIRTDFSRALWENDEIAEQLLAAQPIQRIGEPEDVAGMALFLASEASAYCTGGVYMVDAGYTG